MNADDWKNKPLASKYGIDSYPTIKFFGKGEDKTPVDYKGSRSEDALVQFLNEKCGTHRAVGGGLNAQVCTFLNPTPLNFTYRIFTGWPCLRP